MLYAAGDAKIKKKVKEVASKAVASPDQFDAHSQWILIYELYRAGAIKKVGDDTSSFKLMKSEGVVFCDMIPTK